MEKCLALLLTLLVVCVHGQGKWTMLTHRAGGTISKASGAPTWSAAQLKAANIQKIAFTQDGNIDSDLSWVIEDVHFWSGKEPAPGDEIGNLADETSDTTWQYLASYISGKTPGNEDWGNANSLEYLLFKGVLRTNGKFITTIPSKCGKSTHIGFAVTFRAGGGIEFSNSYCSNPQPNQPSSVTSLTTWGTDVKYNRHFWVYTANSSPALDFTVSGNPAIKSETTSSATVSATLTKAGKLYCVVQETDAPVPTPLEVVNNRRTTSLTGRKFVNWKAVDCSGACSVTLTGLHIGEQYLIFCAGKAGTAVTPFARPSGGLFVHPNQKGCGQWFPLVSKAGTTITPSPTKWTPKMLQNLCFSKVAWSEDPNTPYAEKSWYVDNVQLSSSYSANPQTWRDLKPTVDENNPQTWKFFANIANGKTPTGTTWSANYKNAYVFYSGTVGTFGTWKTMWWGCSASKTLPTRAGLRMGGAPSHTGEWIHTSCNDFKPNFQNSITQRFQATPANLRKMWVFVPPERLPLQISVTSVPTGQTGSPAAENSYLYIDINEPQQQQWVAQKGDVLSYWIRWQTSNARIGVDLEFKHPGTGAITTLRDFQPRVTDQNGVASHPAADLETQAYKKWYLRRINLPDAFDGQKIIAFTLAGERDDAVTSVAQFSRIEIIRGTDVLPLWAPCKADQLPPNTVNKQNPPTGNTYQLSLGALIPQKVWSDNFEGGDFKLWTRRTPQSYAELVDDPKNSGRGKVMGFSSCLGGGDVFSTKKFYGVINVQFDFLSNAKGGSGAFIGISCGFPDKHYWFAATAIDQQYKGLYSVLPADQAWHTVQYTIEVRKHLPQCASQGVHLMLEDFSGSVCNKQKTCTCGKDSFFDNFVVSEVAPSPECPAHKVPDLCKDVKCNSGGNPCVPMKCNPGTGKCVPGGGDAMNGKSCDDGNLMTYNTKCQDGKCIGGLRVDYACTCMSPGNKMTRWGPMCDTEQTSTPIITFTPHTSFHPTDEFGSPPTGGWKQEGNDIVGLNKYKYWKCVRQ